MATATSQQARAAACIRKDLRSHFPGVTFRVTSQGYSMGDHVNVRWIDGPLQDDVKKLLSKYVYGKFDGMTDYYDITNSRDDIPQTKYLFCDREASLARKQAAVDWLNKHTSLECYLTPNGYAKGEYNQEWQEFPDGIVYRMLSGYYSRTNPEMDFSKGDAR